MSAGFWWEVLFDAGAIASLVIGVNLLATSIEAALETDERRSSSRPPAHPSVRR